MSWLRVFYRSTIGKKIVMALSGLIGVIYVVLHMLGNLQAFEGQEKLNDYAHFLKSKPGLLWTVRLGLIAAVVLHTVTAYQLARISRDSRPVGYTRWRSVSSTIASRTMRWTGPLLAVFIVYHLLHMTIGAAHPSFQEDDVYGNVVTGFSASVWYVAVFYTVAMLALGLHLYHGIWSMFQSVGINHPKYNGLIRKLATVITIAVVIGFISIPVAVLLAVIT